jgi:hypothetical protein
MIGAIHRFERNVNCPTIASSCDVHEHVISQAHISSAQKKKNNAKKNVNLPPAK